MPTGSRIKEIRKQKGLTQKQLGEKCGMYESQIRKYENGKANPKIETLQKIATALECNLSDLVDSDEYKLHNIELAIKKANDSVLEKNEEIKDEPLTLAAHFDGDEYTEEELEEIKRFAKFVKSQRGFKATDMFKDVGKMSSDLMDKK